MSSGRKAGQLSRGLTPLQYASMRGYEGEAITKVMLELQQDVLLQYIHGPTQQSLLHWAAEHNQVHLLQQLLEIACKPLTVRDALHALKHLMTPFPSARSV
jgi:ankyrin repeat protein